jgi:hypothetical protein
MLCLGQDGEEKPAGVGAPHLQHSPLTDYLEQKGIHNIRKQEFATDAQTVTYPQAHITKLARKSQTPY